MKIKMIISPLMFITPSPLSGRVYLRVSRKCRLS
jgi:hypothetical protein